MDYAAIHADITAGATSGATQAWAAAALGEIAAGHSPIRAVSHPLGFICLPVIRAGDDGVCVHLWPLERDEAVTAQPTTSPMHSHSWDLLSYVLYGEIHNQTLQVAAAPDDPTHRIFEVRSQGDVDEIHATPRLVRPATRALDIHRPGAAYTLRAGEFHVTDVPPGRTAATVALGTTRPGAHDLSLGALDGQTHFVRRHRCDQATTARAARAVADRLSVPAP
jgi:hypothetical protein